MSGVGTSTTLMDPIGRNVHDSSVIPPTGSGLKRIYPFSNDEVESIQQKLNSKLEAEHISYRPSAQGTVAYLEGWKSLHLANDVFGFNGWSSEILNLATDFIDADSSGRISIGMTCMVRVYLRDGTFHDDIGYGSAENQKSKAGAYEKARKEAVTDAMKRALRMFGDRLGNCAYDKAFLREIKQASRHAPPATYHHSTIRPAPVPVPTNEGPPTAGNAAHQQNLKAIAPPPPSRNGDNSSSDGVGLVFTEERKFVDRFTIDHFSELFELDSLMEEPDLASPNHCYKHRSSPRAGRPEIRTMGPNITVSMPTNQFKLPNRPPFQ